MKDKIDLQDSSHGGQIRFLIITILAIFDLPVVKYFLPSFETTGLSVQETKGKIDFQDGGHPGFPFGEILATFNLQVTMILPIKF